MEAELNIRGRAADYDNEPLDLSHHLSHTTKNRAASKVKKFYKYFKIPGIGQLAGGLPNNGYFPYDTLEAKTALPERWTPSALASPSTTAALGGPKKDPKTVPESHLLVPHSEATTDLTKRIDLDTALQYGTAQGYPPLYEFLKSFATRNLHPTIPYAGGADVLLTCGSTDGFSKTIECFTNPWSAERGNPVELREGLLCEEFAYMNAVQTARPRGLNVVPVALDAQGMVAEGPRGLRDVLEGWDFARGKRPHLMYTVTIGQNPTSVTLGMQRRKEIYALCQQYDIIIVEDDPYWYLQYPSARTEPVPAPRKSSGFAFLDSLMPSYLAVDVDGRVVRLDTFSKTVAPGCRLGWITAQPALVERLLRITETSTQQPSGFVQSLVAELIIGPLKGGSGSGGLLDGRGWEVDGWVRWLEGLRGEYERRMNAMCDILEAGKARIKSGRRRSFSRMVDNLDLEATGAGDQWAVIETTTLYEFEKPTGGMFAWIKIAFENHPVYGSMDNDRLALGLWLFLVTAPYKVLASPGAMFAATPEIAEEKAWRYFRVCFSAVPDDELEDITRRLVKGIGAFFDIKDRKVIEDLLDDMEDESTQDADDLGLVAGWC